jgi:putative N6-adenine-specific DNA methylase
VLQAPSAPAPAVSARVRRNARRVCQIGDVMKKYCRGWTGYVLTGNLELAKYIGLKASRRYVLFNGAIECRLLKYDLY